MSSLLNGAPQLVHHPNGEITPFDPANAAAIVPHLATNGYAYHGHGYGKHGYGYPYVYGKRSAEAEAEPKHLSALPEALVAHPNGAVVPVEPADLRLSN